MNVTCRFKDGFVFVCFENDPPTAPSLTLSVSEAIELSNKIDAAVKQATAELLKEMAKG
jgi:hypothetical protein